MKDLSDAALRANQQYLQGVQRRANVQLCVAYAAETRIIEEQRRRHDAKLREEERVASAPLP